MSYLNSIYSNHSDRLRSNWTQNNCQFSCTFCHVSLIRLSFTNFSNVFLYIINCFFTHYFFLKCHVIHYACLGLFLYSVSYKWNLSFSYIRTFDQDTVWVKLHTSKIAQILHYFEFRVNLQKQWFVHALNSTYTLLNGTYSTKSIKITYNSQKWYLQWFSTIKSERTTWALAFRQRQVTVRFSVLKMGWSWRFSKIPLCQYQSFHEQICCEAYNFSNEKNVEFLSVY